MRYSAGGFRGLVTLAWTAWLLLLPAAALADRGDPRVMTGPPAEAEPWLSDARPEPGQPLRVLTVEERLGVARRGELVRVPLFFHEGECRDPDGLTITAAGSGGPPIPYQADDIRRTPRGDVARMHVYFPADLGPWQRKQFHLLAQRNTTASPPPMPLLSEGDRITLAGDDLKVTFWAAGPRAGAIAAIESSLGKVSLPHELLAPRLVLTRQAADLTVARSTPLTYLEPESLEVRELRYAAGPLFAKLVVRIGPRGVPDAAEYTYLVPRTGHALVQTQRLLPEGGDSAEVVGASTNFLLQGRLLLGESTDEQRVAAVPAGVRRLTRSVHGFTTPAVVNPAAKLALLAVPQVQPGVEGIAGGGPDGYLSVVGTSRARTSGANSESLRAFWLQVRYVFTSATDEERLWEAALPHYQPLTAIVDEPWLTLDDLTGRLARLMGEWEATHARDWRQEAARLFTLGDREGFLARYTRGGREGETEVDYYLRGARAAYEQISAGGTRRVMEWEKGRASGPLDPWNVTYSSSCLVPMAAWIERSERADQVALALAEAQRQFNGRTDEFGFPYIDCFHTAFNMQVGSVMMGLYAGKRFERPEITRYWRDVARTQSVLGIYGRGQRTYPSLRVERDNSDLLYQMTSDYFLRIAELAAGEDLWLHPAVHGRYVDCVDVLADQCHRTLPGAESRSASWRRANFFRGQAHDHRWEAWATGPYHALIARAGDRGRVGLTEACYYAEHCLGRWKNWTEITTLFHADAAVRFGLARYRAEPAPPLPGSVAVERTAGGNAVAWERPSGAIAGYRVYRAPRMGGPWTLLNSPYRQPPAALVQGERYVDAQGQEGDVYFVTAVDDQQRESRWFPREPRP